MQIGGRQNNRQIALLAFCDLLGIPGHPAALADAFEILFKVAFHLNGHTVLEQVLLLGDELRGQVADTLGRILTV